MAKSKLKKSNEKAPSMKRDYLFAGQLERIIEERKLYLKKDLSIADLVTILGTNRTYLSEYFGTVLGTNFYEYINRLRIEKACIPLMKEKNNLKLQAISEESGFRSVTTFRRAFFKLMGSAPNAYMKNLSRSEDDK